MQQILTIALPMVLFSAGIAEESPGAIETVVELAKVQAEANVFEDSSRKKPLVLKSDDEASKFFQAAELNKLKAKVDFKKQFVLVFAWKGSGQDRMTFDVLESCPAQVEFQYKPGRTRDLRPHRKIFALQKDVKWIAK